MSRSRTLSDHNILIQLVIKVKHCIKPVWQMMHFFLLDCLFFSKLLELYHNVGFLGILVFTKNNNNNPAGKNILYAVLYALLIGSQNWIVTEGFQILLNKLFAYFG